jgi:hypothetical protein
MAELCLSVVRKDTPENVKALAESLIGHAVVWVVNDAR